MILDDNNNPRVQAHGGAALVNFAEDAPKNILITYLDNIVNKLQDVLVAKVYDVILTFLSVKKKFMCVFFQSLFNKNEN